MEGRAAVQLVAGPLVAFALPLISSQFLLAHIISTTLFNALIMLSIHLRNSALASKAPHGPQYGPRYF